MAPKIGPFRGLHQHPTPKGGPPHNNLKVEIEHTEHCGQASEIRAGYQIAECKVFFHSRNPQINTTHSKKLIRHNWQTVKVAMPVKSSCALQHPNMSSFAWNCFAHNITQSD